MGTTFPVMADPNTKINALYDTGAVRSCMNYEINKHSFFNNSLFANNKQDPSF